MAAADVQDNAQPWTLQEMAAKQEKSLKKKVNAFHPRFAAKFKEDTQGIPNLKQPPCVTLVSKEGKKFWVPRRIVLARCPGLKLILEEKGEGFSGPVELKNLSSKTLEVLIQYLEDGSLHPEWRSSEVIPELCEVAKEYELPLLFKFLEKSLVNLCTTADIAFAMRSLATRLGLERVTEQISAWLDAYVANVQRSNRERDQRLEMLRRLTEDALARVNNQ